jgi:F-box interacting protein
MQLFTDGKHAVNLRRSFLEKSPKYFLRNGSFVGSSSNGLVCFREGYERNFIVWNPATGDFIYTPRSRNALRGTALVGFDIRPCGDYRVVVIVIGEEVQAEMFSRNSNCWKRISNDVGQEAMYSSNSEVVSLDGCMYWRIYGDYTDYTCSTRYENVACFDMWEEKYKFITGPPSTGRFGRFGVVNGSSLGFFYRGEVNDTLDGWVMNGQDQSWTKHYSVVPFTPVQFKSVEEVDMIILDNKLHFYDHATKQFGYFPELSGLFDVVQYKETMFSVNDPTM